MFERFTRAARAVVRTAVAEQERRADPMIGTEHLLVGVASAGDEFGGALLARFGVTPQRLHEVLDGRDADALAAVGIDLDAALLDATRRPAPAPRRGHRPFSAAAKQALEDSLRQALALRHRHIGVEHIALALAARPPHDPALRLLARFDVTAADIRDEVLRALQVPA